MKNNLSRSIRSIASSLRVYYCSVQCTLNAESLHAFHFQKVQLLLSEDYAPHVQFTKWYQQKSVRDANFPGYVLFLDKATFNKDGIFNQHSAHLLSQRTAMQHNIVS